VRRLLDDGMDVNAPAWGPKSPGATPLHLAAQGGHVKIMDELLERGANIDARTKGACGCKLKCFFPVIACIFMLLELAYSLLFTIGLRAVSIYYYYI
jgi:ankyrin repeat protein